MTWVSGVGSADADVPELAVYAKGDGAGIVDAVVPDPVVGLDVAAGPGDDLAHGVVERRGGGAVGQRAVRPLLVVLGA